MSDYTVTDRTRLQRQPVKGSYDRASVHAILDGARICHVGFSLEGQPHVLPTAFGRDGERLILHGAAVGRMMGALQDGVPLCVTVTHLDGLVLARSWFHHSFNFRSVVIFGRARPITDPAQKLAALRCLVEHVTPGRADLSRPPNEAELRRTSVVELPLAEVSAKIRSGGPVDAKQDLELPVWAGHIPLREEALPPVPAE